ncbi:MAG: hypothetical protein NXY57DRAFT_689622 [Lentinula lateritia]|nr:MAG: hypothetical protein NXY57DRAFT_689622 [Lentinula lateritia]
MTRKGHQKPFEPRVKVDNLALNERLRSSYGIIDNAKIKGLLNQAEEDLAGYDLEMERVRMAYEEEMHRLRLRRQGLHIYMTNLTALQSPIRRLPEELLSLIFLHCCKENDLTADYEGCRKAMAMTISCVCTRWRRLALPCPVFWSNLTITFAYRNSKEEEAKLVHKLSIYLKRSKSHPLTLELTAYVFEPTTHKALALIARESHRWQYILFRGDFFGGDNFPYLEPLRLPILETMIFDKFEDTFFFKEPHSEPFTSTLNLKYVVFGSLELGSGAIALSLPLETITSLDYASRTDIVKSLSLVKRCTNLRHLRIDLWVDYNSNDYSDLEIIPQILSIDTLEVDIYEARKHSNSLALFTFPNLVNLTLTGGAPPSFSRSFAALKSLLARSKCHLQVLTIREYHCLADTDVVTLLLQFPTLQELCIEEDNYSSKPQPISTSFITSLHTWKQSFLRCSSAPLVPQLRVLTLKTVAEDFDPSSFVEMITSRWLPDECSEREIGAVCLRSVELHLPGIADAKPYEPLAHIDKAGMRVVVKCEGGYLV